LKNYETPAFEALLHEQESGASSLLYRFIGILTELWEAEAGQDKETSFDIFNRLYSRVAEAHPLMAIFPNLHQFLDEKRRDRDCKSLLNSLTDFRNALNTNIQATIQTFAKEFADRDRIFTFSHSSIVRQALLELKKQRSELTVNITESRPVREGVALAKVLSRAGVRINLYADAAMERALEGSDAVMVGTDWYWKDGFVNKIGTHSILRIARERKIDFILLTDSSKAMENGPADWSRDEHSGTVLFAESDPNIRVYNPYFEAMGFEGVTHQIIDGILSKA